MGTENTIHIVSRRDSNRGPTEVAGEERHHYNFNLDLFLKTTEHTDRNVKLWRSEPPRHTETHFTHMMLPKTYTRKRCIFLFSLTFLSASIVGIITYTDVAKTQNLIVLFMLQGCIANLQGFLNCLIYGWIRGGFKSALNMYNVRGSRQSFSYRKKKTHRSSFMNYQTFAVFSSEEYDTLSDPEINKSRRPSTPGVSVDVM